MQVVPRAERIFVPKRQFLDTEGSFGSPTRPLLPLIISPAFGYTLDNTLNLRNPETPSVIEQEITRLRTDVLGQRGLVSFPPRPKRTMFYAMAPEYQEDLPGRDREFSPVVVYPQPRYLIRNPQRNPRLTAEGIGYEPMNVDGPSFHADADFGLMTVPDAAYETIAYDMESNGTPDQICSKCVRVFADVIQYLERGNVSDSDKEFYLGNSTLKEKQHTIDSSEENENSNRPPTKEIEIKSSHDNRDGNRENVGKRRESDKDNSFASGGHERPSIRQRSSEEINRESKTQENSKEENVIIKPAENIESFAWPPWSTKYEYLGSALADVKKTAMVVGHETLINPRLFNSVYMGKEQMVGGGNGVEGIQVRGNNELEPTKPPID